MIILEENSADPRLLPGLLLLHWLERILQKEFDGEDGDWRWGWGGGGEGEYILI